MNVLFYLYNTYTIVVRSAEEVVVQVLLPPMHTIWHLMSSLGNSQEDIVS